ncbi:hypothetical protein Bca52824_023176 [Brassica carinata]|uniref:Uncharacterized protein n=1 Tax=Brassica carinata TaxID=52824 RepID=A0A8X8ASA1_BRACI|nr:hypothetical protein Bca52824_023176 [Brassica carinata]
MLKPKDYELVKVVEESRDESDKWDCETIITTYSSHNLIGKIYGPDRARKKLSATVAKAKSLNSNRIITLQGKEKLPVEFLPGMKAEQHCVKLVIPPVKRKIHGEETREENAVKTEKREARRLKKETRNFIGMKRSMLRELLLFMVHLLFI